MPSNEMSVCGFLIQLEIKCRLLYLKFNLILNFITYTLLKNILNSNNCVLRIDLTKRVESTLADYIGYLSTWSAYQKLYNEDNEKAEALLKNTERE